MDRMRTRAGEVARRNHRWSILAERAGARLFGRPAVLQLLFGVHPVGTVRFDAVTLLLRAVALPYARDASSIGEIGPGPGALLSGWLARKTGKKVLAVEIDPSVVTEARRAVVGLAVEIVQGDGPGALPAPVDLLVANPPYIATDVGMTGLSGLGLRQLAWDGGPDGTSVISRWLVEASGMVRPGGHLLIGVARRWQPERSVEALLEGGRWEVVRRHRGLGATVWALRPRMDLHRADY
jgi:methylase of polypeptide subunit release factors